jgi:uncharacterized protein YndB with AHSA1/START domain
MVRIEGTTLVERPVEEVFDFVADERNEPKYNPQMLHVGKVTPGAVRVGTQWRAVMESRDRLLELDIEVTEFDRPHTIGSTTRMDSAEIRGRVTFEPDPAGTRLSWSWDLRPRGLMRLAGPLLARVGRQQEAEIWAGLKRTLEGRRQR